jgi:hypothetical protein
MKAFLSILCAFFILAKANAHIQADRVSSPLYRQIYHTPVLVYGSTSELVTDENGKTKGKLTIREVIKGNVSSNVLDIEFIPQRVDPHLPKKPFAKTQNETRIFALYKNEAREDIWTVGNIGFGVDVNNKILPFSGYDTYKKQIYSSKNISIPDFKAGIALFEAKYTYFQEKKANNISIIVENPTKNQTFAFLAKEMMGNLIYTPKKSSKQPAVGRKTVHKNTKKVKRKK